VVRLLNNYNSTTKDELVACCRNELEDFVESRGLKNYFDEASLEAHAVKAAVLAIEIFGLGCNSEIAEELGVMGLYDLAILIDDSSSMRTREGRKRIPALKKGLEIIADMYAKLAHHQNCAKGGILAARFLNDSKSGNNLSPLGISDLLKNHPYEGNTKIGSMLETRILKPLVYDRLRANKMDRPLLVMVVTDGKIEGERPDVLKKNIQNCITRLASQSKLHWVVFQFTRIGNDKDAEKFLRSLQNDKDIGDYVSCETADWDVEDIMEGDDPEKQQRMRNLLIGAIKKRKEEEPTPDDEDD